MKFGMSVTKRLDLPDWVNSVYDGMFSAAIRTYARGDEDLLDIITQAIEAWDSVASLVHERSNEGES